MGSLWWCLKVVWSVIYGIMVKEKGYHVFFFFLLGELLYSSRVKEIGRASLFVEDERQIRGYDGCWCPRLLNSSNEYGWRRLVVIEKEKVVVFSGRVLDRVVILFILFLEFFFIHLSCLFVFCVNDYKKIKSND